MTPSMPFARYEIWLLHKSRDEPLCVLNDFTYLEYAKRTGRVGSFRLAIADDAIDISDFTIDGRVIVFREPENGPKTIDFAGLLRVRKRYYRDVPMYEAAGTDYNDLLRRRIVAYHTGSTQSNKSDYADDMMKEVVSENLGAGATDTDRDLETSWGLSIAPDLSEGTQIDMEDMGWSNLLEALQDIADASTETEGTRAFFGMVPWGSNGWGMRFQTRVPRWGLDHTEDSLLAEPLVFAIERGNLENPSYISDRRQEVNYVYGGGPGNDSERMIVERESSQVSVSPYNRSEAFYDGRQHVWNQALRYKTNVKLREGWFRREFGGTLLDTPNTRYGLHYGLGDTVTASYLGKNYDVTIDRVHVIVEPRTSTERVVPGFGGNIR